MAEHSTGRSDEHVAWPPPGVGTRAEFILRARVAAVQAAATMHAHRPTGTAVLDRASEIERWLLRDPDGTDD